MTTIYTASQVNKGNFDFNSALYLNCSIGIHLNPSNSALYLQTSCFVLFYRIFLFNLLVYSLPFDDITWKAKRHFDISAGHCHQYAFPKRVHEVRRLKPKIPEILTNSLRNFSPRSQGMSHKLSQTNNLFNLFMLQTLTEQMQLSKAAPNRLSHNNARILVSHQCHD